FPFPLIIAVDASLGQPQNVGAITIGKGHLKPGTGVHKELPPVGDIFITGVVNIGGYLEYLVLQNTRLGLVMKMADCIARAVILGCEQVRKKQKQPERLS
ncbi:MAG: Putative sporulation protein, partial [Thermacetogenium phaeum]